MDRGKLRFTAELVENNGDRPGDRYGFAARFVRAGEMRGAGGEPSGIVVEADGLRAAVEAGKFDGKAVFVDHAGWFENPSLRDLAGVTAGSYWNEDTQSVDGDIHLYINAREIGALLDEVLAQGEGAPDVGLSIVFWLEFSERKSEDGNVYITGVRQVESVDFVFQPAADGRVLAALSAAGVSSLLEVEEMTEEKGLYEVSSPEGELSRTAEDLARAGEWAERNYQEGY